jgi:prolyl-tRNA synthetase
MNSHPGFIKAMWCGDAKCEERVKEIRGTKSRCISETKDYEEETCIVCGKKAKHNVVWGIQY